MEPKVNLSLGSVNRLSETGLDSVITPTFQSQLLFVKVVCHPFPDGCHGDGYQGSTSPFQSMKDPVSLLLSEDITLTIPWTLSWGLRGA